MKKIIIIISLIGLFISDISAQRVIKSKTNSCRIWSAIPDLSNNRINYVVLFDASDMDSVWNQVPYISGQNPIVVKSQQFKYEGYISIPNAWDVVREAQVEQSDVGLRGDAFLQNFCTGILFLVNPLLLNQSQWNLIEE
jgi:hypothetical protein